MARSNGIAREGGEAISTCEDKARGASKPSLRSPGMTSARNERPNHDASTICRPKRETFEQGPAREQPAFTVRCSGGQGSIPADNARAMVVAPAAFGQFRPGECSEAPVTGHEEALGGGVRSIPAAAAAGSQHDGTRWKGEPFSEAQPWARANVYSLTWRQRTRRRGLQRVLPRHRRRVTPQCPNGETGSQPGGLARFSAEPYFLDASALARLLAFTVHWSWPVRRLRVSLGPFSRARGSRIPIWRTSCAEQRVRFNPANERNRRRNRSSPVNATAARSDEGARPYADRASC
ncbi:hypothetical protein MRX96_030649 [Rhipicephalus microplus]